MNGNFGRQYSCGTTASFTVPGCSTATTTAPPPPGNGFFFTGHMNCFGRGGMGPHNARMFHTGRPAYGQHRPPPAQQQHHHQQQQYPHAQMATEVMHGPPVFVPVSQQSYHCNPQQYINGIKSLLNGFINPNPNPQLKCDFYTDHHRAYNPKYRNNYMMDMNSGQPPPMEPPRPDNNSHQSNARIKTAFYNPFRNFKKSAPPLNGNSNNQGYRSNPTTMGPAISPPPPPTPARINFAIFTNEDFPALPTIKRPPINVFTPVQQSAATASGGNRSRRRRCHRAKPPPSSRSSSQKSSSNESDCSSLLSSSAVPASKTRKIPPQLENHQNEVTCDDFVVVTKPKTYNATFENAKTVNHPCIAATEMPRFPYRPQRARQISECSDDSFVICFSDEAREGVLEVARDSDGDDDNNSSVSDLDMTSSSEDDDDDDDDDNIDETDNRVNGSETSQLDSGFDDKKEKKVRFNLNPEIHKMYKWDYAYRAARRGPWEGHARDRVRFQDRINSLSTTLSPVFDTQHRDKIYKERFIDDQQKTNRQQQSTVKSQLSTTTIPDRPKQNSEICVNKHP